MFRKKLTESHVNDVIRLVCSNKQGLDRLLEKYWQYPKSY